MAATVGFLVAPAAAQSATNSRRMVVLVKREAFAPFVDSGIDRTMAVQDYVLGTHVRGNARTVGAPRVELPDDADQAAFVVKFEGTTVARTVGRNGPATVWTRAETRFTATKRVVFEPGQGFVAEPAQVTATTRTMTEGIAPRRGGWIGRIIVRRASQRVAGLRPQIDAIAREKAVGRIQLAFDGALEARLARLNSMTNVAQVMTPILGAWDRPHFSCQTSGDCMQIAISSDGTFDAALPETPDTEAPVQVWLHNSLLGPRVSRTLALLDNAAIHTMARPAFALLRPPFPQQQIGLQQRPLSSAEFQLGFAKAHHWIVLKAGEPPRSATAYVSVLARPRLWTSADGRHTCVASVVRIDPEAIVLRRADSGNHITVSLARLSALDRDAVLR